MKGQNVESILKIDHNVERSERRKSERQKERRKCKNDFESQNVESFTLKLDFRRSDITYGVKKDQNVESHF